MRFLFVLLALIWIFMLLRSIVRAALHFLLAQAGSAKKATARDQRASTAAHRLVRDPECGIYIREDRALPLASGAGTAHFCSSACRDRYFARQQKLAASA